MKYGKNVAFDCYMPDIKIVSTNNSSWSLVLYFYQQNISGQVEIGPGKNTGTFCNDISTYDSETKNLTVQMT